MSKALEDLFVLDLTTEFWSSLGVALLGDFGAGVVRVETLPAAREGFTNGRDSGQRAVWSSRFELANRNKLSVAADLNDVRGREILERLIGKADVFVTDWAFTMLERRGWAYANVRTLRPDIIYVRASGFGPRGPDRDLPALDELAAARTGMMPILPQPGQPPVFTGSGQLYTTVMLAFGVVTALHHREETGEGQEVDVSLYAGNIYGASLDVQAFLAMGGERFLRPVARLDAGNPMSGTMYRSQDGRWVALTMPDTDRWWPAFSGIAGIDAADPRFDTHAKRCEENRLELMRVLEEAFRQRPGEHWKRLFAELRLSADVIEDYSYPMNDEQALRNRYIMELDDPHRGRTKTLGFPIFMSESPARLDMKAACLGQHTARVLHDMLGYSEAEIGELVTNGVVF